MDNFYIDNVEIFGDIIKHTKENVTFSHDAQGRTTSQVSSYNLVMVVINKLSESKKIKLFSDGNLHDINVHGHIFKGRIFLSEDGKTLQIR